jgi:hypothetical protein
MRICLLLLVQCISIFTNAQTGAFNLAFVPDSLKNKATVVTHLDNSELEIESLEKATLKVRKIFTVLNEEAKEALLFRQYTNKAVVLEEAEIKVYDKNGKQTGRYKKKDMSTMAVGDGFIEDGYVTAYYINAVSYPVTVEFDYTIRFKSTLYLPDYRYAHPGEAVIESNFIAKAPPDIGLRYKSRNGLSKIFPRLKMNPEVYRRVTGFHMSALLQTSSRIMVIKATCLHGKVLAIGSMSFIRALMNCLQKDSNSFSNW